MIICENTFEEFDKQTNNKKLVLFGASKYLKLINQNFSDLKLESKATYIIDNSEGKQCSGFELGDTTLPVRAYEALLSEDPKNLVILITSSAYAWEIYEQLESDSRLTEARCFFLIYLITEKSYANEKLEFEFNRVAKPVIPKIIHCFWFSGEEKSELAKRCIESWRTACPDYKIMEWDANNYDVSCNRYMKSAFDQKKWAFASDYARLDVIYRYGGFYFDLDVELYSSLEHIRKYDFVIGYGPYKEIEGAAFGATKECDIVAKMLEIYENRDFNMDLVKSGEIQPYYLRRMFKDMGLLLDGSCYVKDGIAIYPKEVFSDRNQYTKRIVKSPYALGVHHCAGGWLNQKDFEDYERCSKALKRIEMLYIECGL